METEQAGATADNLDPQAKRRIEHLTAANEVNLLKTVRSFRDERPAGDWIKLTIDEQMVLNNEIWKSTVEEGDAYLVALKEVSLDPREYDDRARQAPRIFAGEARGRWQRLTDGMAFEAVTANNYEAEVEAVSYEAYLRVMGELKDRVQMRVLEVWERESAAQSQRQTAGASELTDSGRAVASAHKKKRGRPQKTPDELKQQALRISGAAAKKTRAITVATLVNELNQIKPQMFEDESEYNRLRENYPQFLAFRIAEQRPDLKRKILAIQGSTRHIRLAQELAGAHYGRQLSTIQDDWKDFKPLEFKRSQ